MHGIFTHSTVGVQFLCKWIAVPGDWQSSYLCRVFIHSSWHVWWTRTNRTAADSLPWKKVCLKICGRFLFPATTADDLVKRSQIKCKLRYRGTGCGVGWTGLWQNRASCRGLCAGGAAWPACGSACLCLIFIPFGNGYVPQVCDHLGIRFPYIVVSLGKSIVKGWAR